MATTTDTSSETTLQLYTNPLLIQDKQLSLFEEYVFDGRSILDGNNVFTFGLEMDATMTAGIVNEMVNGFQSLYPARAQTMADLYRHMSDYDYVDMFSTPAGTTIEVMFDRDFLINNAPVNNTGADYNKVVIPEHSTFKIGGHIFGIHYPIEIQIRKGYKSNGSIDYDHCLFQCQWDTSVANPLYKLTTNVLEHRIYQREGLNLLCISIPIEQFKIDVRTEDSISSTGFIKRYTYTDNFYAARVFHFYDDQWIELSSTLSDVIYDPSTPTAKVKVLSDIHVLEISLPQVYFTNGQIGNRIKTIVYTTEGEMDLDISTMGPDQFEASFLIDDMVVDDTYSAFLKRIPLLQVVPLSSRISNGSFGKSFTEMKNRVINTIGGDDLLVTPGQIEAHLSDIGFMVSKYIDNITNRIYIARKVITNTSGTPVASGQYKTTITAAMLAEAGGNSVDDPVGNYDTIKTVNDKEFVILPNTVFKYDKKTDCMIPLSYPERQELYNLTTAEFVDRMNSETYTFTPFHIKLSTRDELPMAGAYDLMQPSMSKITFVGENEMTNTQVSLYSFNISHLNNGTGGYRLIVSLFKTNNLKSTPGHTILSNNQHVENTAVILRATNYNNMLVYLKGEYLRQDASGRDIYVFDINTQYKLSAEDTIDSNSFMPINDYATMNIESDFSLEQKFELLFFVSDKLITDADAIARSLSEPNIPKELKNKNMVWVATQECVIKFGEPISSLMVNSFINVKGKTYASYPTTTFATHVVDIYKRDSDGNLEIDENGQLQIKHPVGSLIISSIENTHPELRPPACDIKWTDNDSLESKTSTLYMGPDHLSANAIRENTWEPYRTYVGDDGLYYTIVTGQHRIYTTDLLQKMIETIDNNRTDLIFDSESQIYRNIIDTDTGVALDSPISSEFVYVRHVTDESTLPQYSIYCTNNQTINPTYTIVDFSKTSMKHLEVIDDYNGWTVDEDGNVEWKDVNPSDQVKVYGALYRRDANKANFNYHEYIDLETLREFYSDVDSTTEKQPTDAINIKYHLPKEVSKQLMDMRFPWIKVAESGNFDIIKEYWNTRIKNNFTNDLIINSYKGISALEFIQTQADTIGRVKRFEIKDEGDPDELLLTMKKAIDAANSSKEYNLIWCDIYDDTKDETRIDEHGAVLINELDINQTQRKGALLWPGSTVPGSPLYGKHYVVITGPSLDICYHHVMNINTSSGLAYVCDRYEYDDDNPTISPELYEKDTTIDYCFGVFDGLKHLAKYELVAVGSVFEKNVDYYRKDPRSGKYYNATYLVLIDDPVPEGLYYTKVKIGYESEIELKNDICNGILFYSGNKNGHFLNIIDERIDLEQTNWTTSGGYWPWESTNWTNNIDGASISTLGYTISLSDKTDTKILHLAGDVMIDENGLPVVNKDEDERQLIYRVDMVHVDRKVLESNDDSYASFQNDVRELLRSYFDRLDATKPLLLERTELYYAPTQSLGYGKFKGQDEEILSLPLEMTIDLRLHVLPTVSSDTNMKETIKNNILSIIDTHVATGTVNCAILAEQIRSSMSDTVQFVDVLGINGDTNVQTLIAVDPAIHTPRLKTVLTVEADGSIGVDKGLNLVWSTIR